MTTTGQGCRVVVVCGDLDTDTAARLDGALDSLRIAPQMNSASTEMTTIAVMATMITIATTLVATSITSSVLVTGGAATRRVPGLGW
jgi:hypothetical protein